MNFVSHLDTPNLHYLQQWTGTFLAHMKWESDFESLQQHHDCVLIIDAIEANYRITTTQHLINHGNYLVICSFFSSSEEEISDLLSRLTIDPACYAVICSASTNHLKSINLNEYYHSQLALPNQLRARDLPAAIFETQNKPFKFLFSHQGRTVARSQLWKQLEELDLLRDALWNWDHFSCHSSKNSNIVSDIPLTFFPNKYESPYADLDRLERFREDRRKAFRLSSDGFFRSHWSRSHLIAQQYIDTYFRVLAERHIDTVGVTAHTYNCLLAGQPFLVVAAPGYLEYLRDLGFHTWSGLIDESYDRELNVDRRIKMVVQEVRRLCSLDLNQWLSGCRDIAHYNQQHYINNQWQHWLSTHQDLEHLFADILQDFQQIKTDRANHGKERAGCCPTQTD